VDNGIGSNPVFIAAGRVPGDDNDVGRGLHIPDRRHARRSIRPHLQCPTGPSRDTGPQWDADSGILHLSAILPDGKLN